MNGPITALFFLLALIAAIAALKVKDLLAVAVILTAFGFFVALLYTALGAIDVGFNEAVLGAGVTGVLFVVAIHHTQRRSID
ncbi:MAG: cation:proton antiporter [Acidobacteria bacterium]|nr:cation:proton antiporter [Acidobacteriota bacterium]|tara:strand:- start:1118 stop:1363 length:246 start_codon:yes stop_codon:yes gene_type:complete